MMVMMMVMIVMMVMMHPLERPNQHGTWTHGYCHYQ
jgi:hypothetical protein